MTSLSNVLILTISLLLSVVKSELILLQVLYRHGDRSPVRIYPKDPHGATAWPEGLGELTNIGKEQEYVLGQILRTKYGDNLKFLDKTFNVKDVYVRSTDFDRTLMSAYCMLTGLFPPTLNQTWNVNIKWQPIPVHTVPLIYDDILYVGNKCPAFTTKYQYFMTHDPDVLRVKKENQDLMKYVAENSGQAATYEGMMDILDTLFCEQVHNMSKPQWLQKDNTFDRLMDLREYTVKWWLPTHEMGILKGGNLLKKIYENINTKINKPTDLSQKMIIYSAHDSTVNALLKTMKIFNDKIPQYSACVIVELHSNQTIRVLYRNNTFTNETFTLIIPGCEEFCLVEKFHSILNDSMPDRKKACGITDPAADSLKNIVIANSMMACIIILLLILTITMCCKYHRQRKQYKYMEVPTDLSET